MDLGTVIARGVLNEVDQANVLMPNLENARRLPQKELESEYVCSLIQLLSQFPEDDMYSS